MLTWLLEIFESPDSQARLVTVLITALVAIAVVLINQHLITKREINDKHNEQVERLYITLTNLHETLSQIVDSVGTQNYEAYNDHEREFIKLRTELEMIQRLYFPSLKVFDNELYAALSWIEGYNQEAISEGVNTRHYNIAWVSLSAFLEDLKKLCPSLIGSDIKSKIINAEFTKYNNGFKASINDFLDEYRKNLETEKAVKNFVNKL